MKTALDDDFKTYHCRIIPSPQHPTTELTQALLQETPRFDNFIFSANIRQLAYCWDTENLWSKVRLTIKWVT